MFNVTRRVSFAVAIAMTVGWGIFFLLFLASSTTLMQAQQASSDAIVVLPPGVKINVQVDKKVYRGGDTVLLAIRNDSRLPIWIQSPGTDCPSNWWTIEQLGGDGETWLPVALSKQPCSVGGVVRFTNHSLKTDAWMALVPSSEVGDLVVNAPAGTYRVLMPYLKGKTVTDTVWPSQGTQQAASAQFSIQ